MISLTQSKKITCSNVTHLGRQFDRVKMLQRDRVETRFECLSVRLECRQFQSNKFLFKRLVDGCNNRLIKDCNYALMLVILTQELFSFTHRLVDKEFCLFRNNQFGRRTIHRCAIFVLVIHHLKLSCSLENLDYKRAILSDHDQSVVFTPESTILHGNHHIVNMKHVHAFTVLCISLRDDDNN